MGTGRTNANSAFLHPMATFFSNPPSDSEYRAVIEAFVAYAVAWRGPVMQEDALNAQMNDLAYQEAFDADEASLRSWNVILSTPINQLVAYYGSGFKPAEVADLVVKFLGVSDLAAIAARLK